MIARISWDQALAWRMRRQLLDPVGGLAVDEVVRRLGAVQAQVASSAELAIRLRSDGSEPGEVWRAVAEGRLIKTWAMRGALHLLTPEEGGAFLAVMAAGRSWERPSWQRYFGMTPADIERLRIAVLEALGEAALSREELIEAVTEQPGLGHLGEALRSGWGTLLTPIAWQGDLCHGPSRGTRVTFMRPEVASPRWSGLPLIDEAAPRALAVYLGAYGPATLESFGSWVAGGWFGQRRLRALLGEVESRLAEVDVDGERAFVLAEHLDALVAAQPTRSVRLLGGFDPWVLGPGTDDGRVTPPARRRAVSRQAGWISPVVIAAGVVSATWALEGDEVRVAWFREAGPPPRRALAAEVVRLGPIIGRELRVTLTVD